MTILYLLPWLSLLKDSTKDNVASTINKTYKLVSNGDVARINLNLFISFKV